MACMNTGSLLGSILLRSTKLLLFCFYLRRRFPTFLRVSISKKSSPDGYNMSRRHRWGGDVDVTGREEMGARSGSYFTHVKSPHRIDWFDYEVEGLFTVHALCRHLSIQPNLYSINVTFLLHLLAGRTDCEKKESLCPPPRLTRCFFFFAEHKDTGGRADRSS